MSLITLIKFADRANSSLSQQTVATLVANSFIGFGKINFIQDRHFPTLQLTDVLRDQPLSSFCNILLPPPKKEVMFLVRSVCLFVCLSVCLSVCPSDYPQTCERILTKFFGGVGHGSRTK